MMDFLYLYLSIGCFVLAFRWLSLIHVEVPTVFEEEKDESPLYPRAQQIAMIVAVVITPLIIIVTWPTSVYRRLVKGTWRTDKMLEMLND